MAIHLHLAKKTSLSYNKHMSYDYFLAAAVFTGPIFGITSLYITVRLISEWRRGSVVKWKKVLLLICIIILLSVLCGIYKVVSMVYFPENADNIMIIK